MSVKSKVIEKKRSEALRQREDELKTIREERRLKELNDNKAKYGPGLLPLVKKKRRSVNANQKDEEESEDFEDE